jgi:hypothetical protein
MLQLTGEFYETSWPMLPLPELLWIGLLHTSVGFEEGTAVAIQLSRIAIDVRRSGPQLEHFVAASSFNKLSTSEQCEVKRRAAGSGILDFLSEALKDLHNHYPESPLSFLQNAGPNQRSNSRALERLKSVVRPLLFRHDAPATRLAGAAIGIELETGRLSVTSEATTILRWRTLARYPTTEESKGVGAVCRASVNMIFTEHIYDAATPWPSYFWNRGLELEPCYFSRAGGA